jgi:hypothetical protein
MNTPRVTPAQRRALDNLSRGLPIDAGCSNHGGSPLMIKALRDKGMMDEDGITELGLAAIRVKAE